MANFKRLGNTVFKCNEPTDAMPELWFPNLQLSSVDTKSTNDRRHEVDIRQRRFRPSNLLMTSLPSQSSIPYTRKELFQRAQESDFFLTQLERRFFRPPKPKIITKIGWNKSGTGEKDVKMHFGNYSNWIWPFTSPQSLKTLNLFNLFSLINCAKSLGPKSKLTQMKENCQQIAGGSIFRTTTPKNHSFFLPPKKIERPKRLTNLQRNQKVRTESLRDYWISRLQIIRLNGNILPFKY